MIKRTIEYEIQTEYDGKKISAFLHDMGYPEASLTKLRHVEGSLFLNEICVHMNHFVKEGDCLKVVIFESETSEKIIPMELPLEIVYEDDDIIVVNKTHHMPIHPSLNNYDNSLANALAYYFGKKNEPFVFRCMNRLDRDTSGLTVMAKHYLAAGILSNEITKKQVIREYTAIVRGEENVADLPMEGVINKPIGRKTGSTIERFIDYENGEYAVTRFNVVREFEFDNVKLKLVKCILETGRTHQIRVHFKSIGYPLIGDFLYNPEDTIMDRQGLHAGKLSFYHPITGEYMEFETKLPEDMRRIISN